MDSHRVQHPIPYVPPGERPIPCVVIRWRSHVASGNHIPSLHGLCGLCPIPWMASGMHIPYMLPEMYVLSHICIGSWMNVPPTVQPVAHVAHWMHDAWCAHPTPHVVPMVYIPSFPQSWGAHHILPLVPRAHTPAGRAWGPVLTPVS